MYIIRISIFVILLLSLNSCVTKINMSPLLPTSNYLLVVTTIDNTADNAKAKALNLLSQNILVEIQSNFVSNEILKVTNKEEFTSTVVNKINLNTIGYFKGLTFSDSQFMGNNQYKVSVGLTSTALINSITYLNQDLKISIIDNMVKSDLQKELNKTNFLIALIMYANTQNIVVPNINLHKLSEYKEKLIVRTSNVSRINFNILPNLNSIAKININNNDYNPQDPIFLPRGVYYYTVYAKGYKTITNKIEISNSNDQISVDLYLQKLLPSPIKVKLNITTEDNTNINTSELKLQISSLIEKFQLQENNFTDHVINVNFLSTSYNLLNNFYYFNLPVTISLVNKDKILTRTCDIKYVNNKLKGTIDNNILLQNIESCLEELTSDNNLSLIYK